MLKRRNFLKTIAAGGALAALPGPFRRSHAADDADLVLRLIAAPARVPIWRGSETNVLRYQAQVVQGRKDSIKSLPGYLGPVLDLRRGERVRIEFVNRIGEPSIIHWHGMIVPERSDGHPRFAVSSGESYTYNFTVRNPAGTYLYHPHPHRLTGKQVYFGLAGMLIVRDEVESTLHLPDTAHELTLVIQDRRVGDDNQFIFRRMMMDEMTGVLGDQVFVNGVPNAAFRVTSRPYRLRLANVSNARIYKLAWSDGSPMRVIAGDNGLFSRDEGVQVRPYVVLAPFERVELFEDFGQRRIGGEIALISQEFSDNGMMGRGMMGRMMGGGMMSGGQGDELVVARFTVSAGRPPRANPLRLPDPDMPIRQGGTELHTRLAFSHMRGTLNGRTFKMQSVADDERLPLNRGSVWTFSNERGGMMAMPHPMHIHGVRFRVLERSRGSAPRNLLDGLIDTGFKDTFLIFPGERVRVLVAPTEPGLFVYHCHNLEHEDGGMMRNCRFG